MRSLSETDRPITVLHVLNELKPSGAEVMLRTAAPHWRQANIKCTIVSTGADVGPYAPVLGEAGYAVEQIPFERSLRFAHRMFQFLRANRFDVVHVHTERANFWIAGAAVLAGTRRVVRTIHSVFPFQGGLRAVRGLQRALLRLMGVRHVSIGPSVQAVEWERFRNQTVCIPNWYDPRLVPPTEAQRMEARRTFGIAAECLVIVTVGNCSPVKNHHLLFEALGGLPATLPFTYLHVGQEQAGAPERAVADELRVGDRTRFMGFVQDIMPVLWAADVFVMPSTHEGLGVAAIEAMGVGLISILTDVPGLRDLRELGDGITYVAARPEPLRAALQRVAEMPAGQRRTLGKTLATNVRARYGVTQGVQRYEAIYRA